MACDVETIVRNARCDICVFGTLKADDLSLWCIVSGGEPIPAQEIVLGNPDQQIIFGDPGTGIEFGTPVI